MLGARYHPDATIPARGEDNGSFTLAYRSNCGVISTSGEALPTTTLPRHLACQAVGIGGMVSLGPRKRLRNVARGSGVAIVAAMRLSQCAGTRCGGPGAHCPSTSSPTTRAAGCCTATTHTTKNSA